MGKSKYDWQKIEQEYTTGDMSLLELSEKYHISQTTIYKKAKEGKFDQKRQKYREKVAKKAITRASTRDAMAIARIMTAAERTIRKLTGAITDDTVYGYLVEEPITMDEETGELRGGKHVVQLTKADTKALVNLSTAIRNLAMATRVMYPEGDGTGKEEEDRGVIMMPQQED